MEHSIEIEKIIYGGEGLGRLDNGMVAMVPHVLPGEKVRIQEINRRKNHIRAEIVALDSASAHRIPPPCFCYQTCGGCNLQHVDYHEQLIIKQGFVRESLQRSKLDIAAAEILPTVASPDALHYRHKIRLHLDTEGNPGFHRNDSNEVIPVEQCLLATKGINDSLPHIRAYCSSGEAAGNWEVVEVLESPASGEIIAVFYPGKSKSTHTQPHEPGELGNGIHSLIRDKAAFHGQDAVNGTPLLRQSFVTEKQSYELCWDSHCFFQTNVQQNRQLVEMVCQAVGEAQPGGLLDLYCGMGNFSVPLALLGWKVTGIEHNQRSIYWAKHNAAAAGLADLTFSASPVAVGLKGLRDKKPHTIVLDPPRLGLDNKSREQLPLLRARKIIYVSCDPATLARDLAHLCATGYHIKSVTPVDLFPQTHHIESLTILEKN